MCQPQMLKRRHQWPQNAEALSPIANEQVKRQKGFAHTQHKGERAKLSTTMQVCMCVWVCLCVRWCTYETATSVCAPAVVSKGEFVLLFSEWRFFRPSAFKQIKYDTLAFRLTYSILVLVLPLRQLTSILFAWLLWAVLSDLRNNNKLLDYAFWRRFQCWQLMNEFAEFYFYFHSISSRMFFSANKQISAAV